MTLESDLEQEARNMANHGYTTTKKFMSIEKIDADLREFIARHCGGIAEVEGPFDLEDELAGWFVTFLDDEYERFSVWLHSRRKLEFRHPLGAKVPYWAQALFQHEMAKKYNGRISDDGYEGSNDPDPEGMDTFTKYTDLMASIQPTAAARALTRRFYTMHLDKRYKEMPSY